MRTGWALAVVWVMTGLLVAVGPGVVGGSPSALGAPHLPGSPSGSLAPAGSRANAATEVLSLVPEPSGTATGCVEANVSNPYPQLTEGYLGFQGDLFNVPSGSVGGTTLCYDATSQTLYDATSFSRVPGAAQYGVLGYPEAILGENIWGGDTGIPNSVLPLPNVRIENLTTSDAWVDLNYSVSAPGSSPYDFAFDDWFSQIPANATSAGNVGNRIELMIWLSNDLGMYLGQTPVAVPTYLNGSAAPGTWFRDQLCTGSDEITFDYLYAPDGSAPGYGVPQGAIAFNLTYLLDDVSRVMSAGACWATAGTDIGPLFADNFPLGAEFYPTPSDTAHVDWSVTSMCYIVNAGEESAPGPSCGSSPGRVGTPLVATATSNVARGTAPLTVRFTGGAIGGSPPYRYFWTFGDGAASTLESTSHTYGAGDFRATLQVTDGEGNESNASIDLSVTGGASSGSGGVGGLLLGAPLAEIVLAIVIAVAVAFGVLLLRRRSRRRSQT